MNPWAKRSEELRRVEAMAKRRENPTPVDAFVWKVLREGYADVICRLTGMDRSRLLEPELSAMLEPHFDSMDRSAFAIAEAIERTKALGSEALYAKLSGMPGVDREMLDQTLDFVLRDDS